MPRKGKIDVSAKIIADISSGIYRTPANALKELVSNSFDANAHKVIITTDYPDFDVMTCIDDGDGMTIPKFEDIMSRIGGSDKRSERDRTSTGRPIIGKIGIGVLAIAQICNRFTVISSVEGQPTRFEATINLSEFHQQDTYKYHLKDTKVRIGEYDIEDDIPEEPNAHYTRIVLEEIDEGFKRRLRKTESPDRVVAGFQLKESDPKNFEQFIKWVEDKRIRDISEYLRFVWELALMAPVPYFEEGPVPDSEIMGEIRRRLKNYDFTVIVDGIQLRKPVLLPYGLSKKEPYFDYKTYDFEFDGEVAGSRLFFHGYIYHQNEAISPPELRGIMVRIREVGIGSYDKTLFNFPSSAGPIIAGISGEVYVEEGLEDALNIDRNSFRETNPHFLKLQEAIFEKLSQTERIPGVLKDARIRSRVIQEQKRMGQETDQYELLLGTIKEVLGKKFKIEKVDGSAERPVKISAKESKILIYRYHQAFPRKTKERWIYERLLIFYELATMHLSSKSRVDQDFYSLLERRRTKRQ